jgi:hypothetical protein
VPELEEQPDNGGQCVAPPPAYSDPAEASSASASYDPASTGGDPAAAGGGSAQSMVELYGHYGDDSSSSSAAPNADSSGGPAAETVDNAGGGGAGGAPNTGNNGAEGADGSGGGGTGGAGAAPEKSLWQRAKDWWNGDSDAPQAASPAPEESPAQPEEPKAEAAPAETPGDKDAQPAEKKPSEMTPEEREADRVAKMEEYAKQSPDEKQARWAKQDGKLDKDTWKTIQKIDDPAARKQAMLQAGIDKLDYDDPRKAELEKVQNEMNGKDSRTGGAYTPGTAQTGCGGTADEMLRKGGDPTQPAFPGYFKGGERETLPAGETPKSGDVYELQNPNGDIHGHAGTFCVSSPDGKTWLTYDGGQQPRTDDKQQIKLVTRNVSVDSQGRTIVGAPDTKSGTNADNGGRPVSGVYDYQKMYNKYPALHPPTASQ